MKLKIERSCQRRNANHEEAQGYLNHYIVGVYNALLLHC
jgi:hypothetical protein